ncbi:MAG: Hpt domain-containing protein [Thiogranum sp.]|nr:Hpt domain-containing protein [Thiogranum sp.]
MNQVVDFSTLVWVKHELDETLREARQALESHVEDPSDQVQLGFLSVHLHQVYGTLQMVELYGAALLAEEMELVVKAVATGSVSNRDEACEVLMRAILQLPDYLDRLIAGYRDIPIVLLPILNDLRAVRGETLLSDNAMFSPDLSATLPDDVTRKMNSVETHAGAKELRHKFQLGLLGWLRDRQSDRALTHMGDVLGALVATSSKAEVARLWWIAGGVVEALLESALEPAVAIKRLFGQLDREIKRLADLGESAVAQEPPLDLVKNLLFYAGQSKGHGTQNALIKETYRLSDHSHDEEEMAAARESMSGQNADLFATVSVAVKEELARLKDSLDIILRSGPHDSNELIPLVDSLNSLGDTLGMLSLDTPRKAMLAKANDLRVYTEAGELPPETLLMDVASTLLFVESSVDGLGTRPNEQVEDISIGEQIARTEYDQVMGVVLQEAIADLGRGKEAIVNYAESPQQVDQLEGVPQLFNQVKGGLLLLGETRAAALIGALARFVKNELIDNKRQAHQQELESLADSICGLEYFLEGRREHRMFGGAAISIAEDSVEKLGYSVDEQTEGATEKCSQDSVLLQNAMAGDESGSGASDCADEYNSVVDTIEPEVPDASAVCETAVVDEPDLLETEPEEDVHFSAEEVAACDEATDSEMGVTSDSFSIAESSTEAPQCDDLPIIGPDTDEEILEIFIEEAEEEISSIEVQLPAWMANPENGEALSSIRRSYHTLKGSGRLVGAMRIGEFAWAFETMLNRLIDGAISVTPAMLETLQSASSTLPELVRQIKERHAVAPPIAYLMACAEALSKGDSLPKARNIDVYEGAADSVAPAVADEASPIEAVVTEESVMQELPDDMAADLQSAPIDHLDDCHESTITSADKPEENVMDAMLYEIFNAESTGHLEVINQYLDHAAEGALDVDESLARALHTLHGSAHMANAPGIADLAGEFERYVKALLSAELPMPDTGCSVLRNSAQMIETMLAALPAEEPRPEDFEQTILRIQELRQSVPAAIKEVVSEAGAPADPDDGVQESDSECEPELRQAPAIEMQSDIDCDQELIQVFLEESQDCLEVCDATLSVWREYRGDSDAIAEYQRALHTLKGGARMADLPQIGDLAHTIEALVETLVESGVEASDAMLDSLARANDLLIGMLEFVRDGRAIPDPHALITELEEVRVSCVGPAEEPYDATADSCKMSDPARESTVEDTDITVDADVDAFDPYSDVDSELLDVFLEEANDILEHSDDSLRSWKGSPDDPAYIAQLQRELHTLKGGARMADITEIGDLAHAVESLMVAVSDGAISRSDSMFVVLGQAHDALGDMVERVSRRQPLLPATKIMELLNMLQAGQEVQDEEVGTDLASASSPSPAVVVEKSPDAEEVAGDRRHKERAHQELVRVKAHLLDNMVNYAGEVSIYRSRLEQKIGAYRFNLVEMEQTVARLREQLRKLEIETEAQVLFRYETENVSSEDQFDPLEMDRYSHMQQLSRSLVESVSDLGSIQNLLENLTSESETLLLQQSRVNTELQEGLMRTRMVPFLGLAARMRRIVRQTSHTVGKKAELELSGAEGEMDRTVVDRIIAPIEHMLRNAISHGIEDPSIRLSNGKPESGTIRITLERESSDVVLKISDDGAGIDLTRIREKAIERGLMAKDAGISDEEALQFILETGFSTAEKVTQVAGRGVGMDVVNSEVKQLGGSLHIGSEWGKGTTFTMRLPFTLALNQALLVEVGEDTYAIPLSSIEGIVRLRREDLARYYEGGDDSKFSYAGFDYRVSHLGTLLGTGTLHIESGPKRVPVLLARVGEHAMAFQVENLLGSREIVVKSVGPQISTVRGVSGATILGDGRVVMILDLIALLRSSLASPMAQVEDMLNRPLSARQLTVMVVDDSITVRKVTTRLLERNDMQVLSAKDGVDAVSKLQENIPDIMLLDIEMPRMDGFELATHVRNEPRLKNIPIIMITSRTGDKHRQRAMQIGVNRYLGKPFQEIELLNNIRGLLEEQGS